MPENSIKESAEKFGLHQCDRCGTCAAVCPMREVYPDFNRRFAPRSTIARLRIKNALAPSNIEELLEDNGLWMCLACEACLNTCPQGVEFRNFVENIRDTVLKAGKHDKFSSCSCCGKTYLPKLVVEALGRYFSESEERDFLLYCPKCRRRAQGIRQRHLNFPGKNP